MMSKICTKCGKANPDHLVQCSNCGAILHDQILWASERKRPFDPYIHLIGVSLLFDPRDLWIGVFWKRDFRFSRLKRIYIYFSLIPTLVLKFEIGNFK